jgi:DNA mismatch endonuclease, patch repair protein
MSASESACKVHIMDNMTKRQRSWTMSRIRSAETNPERSLRSILHREGCRFRKNVKGLPGRPDIVFAKYRTVVFVNGCFWHHHPCCCKAVIPKSNERYWTQKLENNVLRDKLNNELLLGLGWKVITIWECEFRKDPESVLSRIRAMFRK